MADFPTATETGSPSTTPDLPALTTTFTPIDGCLATLTYNAAQTVFTELLQDPFRRESRCFPSGFYTTATEFDLWTRTINENGVQSVETLNMADGVTIGIASFSPGLFCPYGYTTAGETKYTETVTKSDDDTTTELKKAKRYCCPSGFNLVVNSPTEVCKTTFMSSTIAFITDAAAPSDSNIGGGVRSNESFSLALPSISVFFSASVARGENGAPTTTLPPSSLSIVGPGVATVAAIILLNDDDGSGSGSGGLSTGAKAGVGVGAVVAVLGAAFLIFFLMRRRKQRRGRVQNVPEAQGVPELHGQSAPAPPPPPPMSPHPMSSHPVPQPSYTPGSRPAVFGAGGVHELDSGQQESGYKNPAFKDTSSTAELEAKTAAAKFATGTKVPTAAEQYRVSSPAELSQHWGTAGQESQGGNVKPPISWPAEVSQGWGSKGYESHSGSVQPHVASPAEMSQNWGSSIQELQESGHVQQVVEQAEASPMRYETEEFKPGTYETSVPAQSTPQTRYNR